MVKIAFLDRDGVINKLVDNRPPWRFEEFEFIDGVQEAVDLLKKMGYVTQIVTNQPDVDDGLMEEAELVKINNHIVQTLSVDGISVARTRGTECYKPNPGMLNKIINKYKASTDHSWMIGDTWKDISAGANAGVRTIYIGTDRRISTFPDCPTIRTTSLKGAASFLKHMEN